MNGAMQLIGLALRTPFALVGLALATVYGIGYALLQLVVAVLWVVFYVPLSFVGFAMGGEKRGKSAPERYKEELASNVRSWKYTIGGSFGMHGDLLRWWSTGSADKRPTRRV